MPNVQQVLSVRTYTFPEFLILLKVAVTRDPNALTPSEQAVWLDGIMNISKPFHEPAWDSDYLNYLLSALSIIAERSKSRKQVEELLKPYTT